MNSNIADLKLPDGHFLSVLEDQDAKDILNKIKIIVVSSIDDMDALRTCYKHGALDYLIKPFSKNELVVKLERIAKSEKVLKTFGVEKSIENVITDSNFDVFDLTSKERKIMSTLIEHNNQMKKNRLIEIVWSNVSVQPKTLDVHLSNLRKKLEPYGLNIYSNSLGELVLTDRVRG